MRILGNGVLVLKKVPPIRYHVNAPPPRTNPALMFEDAPEFAGPYGQLTPVGGGDPIPLAKKTLLVGRKGKVDIALQFPNVSSQHCRMTLEHGYWFVRDLGSRNGTKVDNRPIVRKRVDPGSKLSIAKHTYEIEYEPQLLGAFGPPPPDDDHVSELLGQSLMNRAGLEKRKR